MKRRQFVKWGSLVFIPLLIGALLTGCGNSDDGSSTTSPATSSGLATLSLTDAPADDCTSVVISISSLIFKAESDTEETGDVVVVFDSPISVELSALSGGLSFPLLDEYAIPAGSYEMIPVSYTHLTLPTTPYV